MKIGTFIFYVVTPYLFPEFMFVFEIILVVVVVVDGIVNLSYEFVGNEDISD